MNPFHTAAVLIAALLLLLSLPQAALAAPGDVRAVDDEQYLATDEAAEEFRENGVVSADIDGIQLEVTVANEPEDINVSGWRMGNLRRFVRVDYDESISRTVRLHVNEEIISPRPSKGSDPLADDGPTADFVTPRDGHQSVTLHLTGETDSTYALSEINGELWAIRSTVTGVWSNATGVSLPSLGGGEWQRPPDGALEGTNPTYEIPASETIDDMTIQYRTGEESWLSTPACQADTPVCYLDRDNKTVLFASQADPPPVRYKLHGDLLSDFDSAWSDLKSVPRDALEAATNLVGGGS